MARYSKIFFVFIILVLSLWLIPWFYHFMTAQPIRNPFTLYSCIIDDFACLDYSENKGCSGEAFCHVPRCTAPRVKK